MSTARCWISALRRGAILQDGPVSGRYGAPIIGGSPAHLIGEWEGEGWIIRGPGPRTTFRQKEFIAPAANRTAVTLRGEGSVFDSASGRWRVVFEAGGLLTYDAAEKRYKMLNVGGNGRALALEPEIRENGMTWGFDMPGSRIRYVISHPPDGTFTEIGEMSADNGAT